MKGLTRSIAHLIKFCMILTALLLFFGCEERHPEQGYRFQYAAKALCTQNIPGTSQTTSSLLPGVYKTVVNIHNPANDTVRFRMKIAVASGQVSQFNYHQLGPDEAMKVDCSQILGDFGLTFIHGFEGFLVIESFKSLDVAAVYTAGHNGGDVESIAVEQIPERKIKRQPPTGQLADLVVRDIDLNSVKVVCPGGAGTCVTTATFTVANIGAGDAGAFNIKIVADPSQSVEVNQAVPGGLVAGGTATFTITTPAGGNCFDPDCTICITVDNLNTVPESNESNNQRCETIIG